MKNLVLIVLTVIMGMSGCASATGRVIAEDWSDFWTFSESGTASAIAREWVDLWTGDYF